MLRLNRNVTKEQRLNRVEEMLDFVRIFYNRIVLIYHFLLIAKFEKSRKDSHR